MDVGRGALRGARHDGLDWHIHAVLVSGVLIVSLANYYAGPSTLYPLLYMWTALYAFYFFATGPALAHLAYLHKRGEIERVDDGDRILYQKVKRRRPGEEDGDR